jgi:hypothetical protein
MTPESELPRYRGVPTTHDLVSPGDYVQVQDGETVVAGYVEMRDGQHACIAEHSGAVYLLDVRDRFVQMVRPRGVLPDGVAVWYRTLEDTGAERWFKAEVARHFYVGVKPRYNLRYLSPDFEGAYNDAAGVHPEDIELREVNPKPDTSINPHLMHEQSTTLREIGELAIRQGANRARAVYDQVVEALSLTEQRGAAEAQEIARGKFRHEVEQLLNNFNAPKPDHWGVGRGDAMEWLAHALMIARGDRRERTALAAEMTKIGASPAHSVTQMFEFVIAKTRAEARSNATAHAEQAAEAKIRQLEQKLNEPPSVLQEHTLEAMSLLAQRIPGVQGFTLPQKLREVLAEYDNRISGMELALASRKPTTVIVGADRVRAVIERELDGRGPAELMLMRDLGGWFLRTLANANLAVVVYNWDGIDPVAEPAEETVKTAPAPPTLDDVKAAWGTMVAELDKIPEVLRDVLKDRP